MNPVTISLSLASSSANNIALNQTLASATNLTLNGSLVSGGIATMDVARRVAVTSAGNDAGINWVLTGGDRYGNALTETFAGVSSAASYSNYDYLTITRIRATGATAAGVTAGTNGVGSTAWYCKEFGSMGTLGVAIYMATQGVNTGNFEITWDDPNAFQAASLVPYQPSVNPQSNTPPIAWPADGLTQINQSTRQQISDPCFAWRWTTTSGTTATVIQVIESTWADQAR